MTTAPLTSGDIIADLGGVRAVLALLAVEGVVIDGGTRMGKPNHGYNRVSNWRRYGIPLQYWIPLSHAARRAGKRRVTLKALKAHVPGSARQPQSNPSVP